MATKASARGRGGRGRGKAIPESNHPGLGFGTPESPAAPQETVPAKPAAAPIAFIKSTQSTPKIFNYTDEKESKEESPVMDSNNVMDSNDEPAVSKDSSEAAEVESEQNVEAEKIPEIKEKEAEVVSDKEPAESGPKVADEDDDIQVIEEKKVAPAAKKVIPKKIVPVGKPSKPILVPKIPPKPVAEEWSSCKLCFFSFSCIDDYKAHCAGMMHKQRLTKQATNDKMEKKKELTALANIRVDKEYKDIIKPSKPVNPPVPKKQVPYKSSGYPSKKQSGSESQELYCDLCMISCTGQANFDMHVQGQKHQKNLMQDNILSAGYADIYDTGIPKRTKTTTRGSNRVAQLDERLNDWKCPLIGLKFVVEIQKEDPNLEPRYYCELCDSKADPRTLITHLTGVKHRQKYMRASFPEKLEELVAKQTKKSAAAPILENMALEIEQVDGRPPLRVQVEVETTIQNQPPKRPGPFGPPPGNFKRPRMDDDFPGFEPPPGRGFRMLPEFFEGENGFGHPMRRDGFGRPGDGFPRREMMPPRDMMPRDMMPPREMMPRDMMPPRDMMMPRDMMPPRDLMPPRDMMRPRDRPPRDMLMPRDILPRDLMPRKMIPRDMPMEMRPREMSRDMLPRDVLPRDLLPRDVMPRDILSRDMLSRDVLSREGLSRDVLSREGLSRDVLSRDVLSREGLSRDLISRDALARDAMARELLARELGPRKDWRESLEREKPIMPPRPEPRPEHPAPRPFGTRDVPNRDPAPRTMRDREKELFDRVRTLGLHEPFSSRPSQSFNQPRQEAGNLLSSLSNLGKSEAIQVSKALQALLQLQSRK